MWLVIVQINLFLLWNFSACTILFLRLKKPYQTFRKTHVWGKIEKLNLLTFNTFVFATFGVLINTIYNLFNSAIPKEISITLTFFASLVYLLSVTFYVLEIFLYFKVKQNPLWLYKERKAKKN
ncbi:hypothetical protein [Mycoplasma procyoni]|uniref:hypothetical protein n=1 Tax=Mycoplasma procyoni TaxID=568784 RepID=UPI00197CAEBB|nr:hypothetical protein [Mycoplasma procyoni]MBN3534940.1 hypothetical protein [Mycoplasma procyoni]